MDNNDSIVIWILAAVAIIIGAVQGFILFLKEINQ